MNENGRMHHHGRTMTQGGGVGVLTRSRGWGARNRTEGKGLFGEDAVLVSHPWLAELFRTEFSRAA